MLLDEATSALDAAAEREVQTALDRIMVRHQGRVKLRNAFHAACLTNSSNLHQWSASTSQTCRHI